MKTFFKLLLLITSFSVYASWDDAKEHEMIASALEARVNAYCPYSNYQVGAAILTEDLEVVTGCNVENAAYNGACAERHAIGSSITQYGLKPFLAIVVATKDGLGFPCGGCRQCLNEFSPNMTIITVDENGDVKERMSLSDLFAKPFGPHNL